MVRLLCAKISNLYSYDQIGTSPADKSEPISFSNINVIVGPNDSGKSNIFRAIKLLVDSMRADYTLTNSDIFSDQAAPKLDAEFQLSDKEAGVLLDFLGVYYPHSNQGVQLTFVHQFRNRDAILISIKELRLEVRWQPSSNASLFPMSVFHFEKLGLKIYSNAPAGPAFATPEFPFNEGRQPKDKFPEFLDNLAGDKDQEHQSAVDLRDSKDWDFTIMPISSNNLANPITDRAYIERLQGFAGLTAGTSNTLSFSNMVGAILNRSFLISTGGTIFHRKRSLIEQVQNRSRTLDQEMRDSVRYPAPLDSDGWNLAEYLFNLKNSVDSQERDRFRVIQGAFKTLFPNLSVDAVKQPIKFTRAGNMTDDDFRYPSIVINDARNSKQFSFDRVGAGISETLFLLTAFLGSSESVVLLDEPAVNLHPAQMKALFQMLSNTSNQLLVITHSPVLLRHLLFEKEASVIYVRRPDNKSVVSILDTKKTWTDAERYKLSYLIDTRIFFARHVLLGEGESDMHFLETAAQKLGFSPDTYEDIVIDAGGKYNLPKYRDLLERFAIPYLVVADADKEDGAHLQSRAVSYGSVKDCMIIDSGQFPTVPTSKVFFFKKDVEEFMRAQDPILYTEVEKLLVESGVKATKPIFIHEFVPKLLAKNPNSLDTTIRPLLDYAFDVRAR